jgi:MFS family permease
MEPNPTNHPPEPQKMGKPSPYEILRNSNFRLYLSGRFIASFGQQMLTVGVGWELYERTHSALALGFVGLTQMIPMLAFTLPAGHLADNRDRKTIIMAMITLSLAGSLGLLASSLTKAPVGWIYASLFVSGVARSFLWPSSSAFMPQLVSRSDLHKAVTWNTGSFHLSSVVGPATGGALLAMTGRPASVYLADALSIICCLFLMGRLKVAFEAPKREPMTFRTLGAGFHFVFENPIVLSVITLDLFAVLLGGATSLLPIYAKDILKVGPSGLGALQGALPAGSFICAMALAHLPPIQKAGRSLLAAVTLFGVATIIFAISQNFLLSLGMLALCGMADNISVVIRHTLVQLLTPNERRGRVSAVNSLFIGTSNELGGFESGLAAYFFGPVISVAAGGAATILVVIAVGLIWPQLRHYGRLDSPE